MNKASNTATDSRHDNLNQNQTTERAITMKKKISSIISIVLALTLASLTFTGAGCDVIDFDPDTMYSAKEFQDMLRKGGEITLKKNVYLDRSVTVSKSVNLYLNGKSILDPVAGLILFLN